jgi:hypothetical protein
MNMKIYMAIGFLLSGCALLFAQNSKEQEIEDIYLKNPELMVIREQVYSSDFQTQLQALDQIEGMVKGGTINTEIENLIIVLGDEGSATKKYEGKTVVNNYPEVRRKACALLGQIGTEKARGALITILLSESEAIVKAEAAYALGVIGKDDKGDSVEAIAWVINKEDPIKPDNNFAYAATLAIEKIAEKNNGLKNANGYAALIKIAQGNYIRTVKDKALAVIKGMKKYNR